MPKPKSAKLLCTPNVFERCFLNQPHLPHVPVRLYIRMVDGKGGGEVSCTISNIAFDANAEAPLSGGGRKRRKEKSLNKKIKGGLKNIAKVGKMASLAAAVTGNPEVALPLGVVSEAFDIVGSGHEEHDDFSHTIKKIATIPKKKKKVPRYTLAAAKKNFEN